MSKAQAILEKLSNESMTVKTPTFDTFDTDKRLLVDGAMGNAVNYLRSQDLSIDRDWPEMKALKEALAKVVNKAFGE